MPRRSMSAILRLFFLGITVPNIRLLSVATSRHSSGPGGLYYRVQCLVDTRQNHLPRTELGFSTPHKMVLLGHSMLTHAHAHTLEYGNSGHVLSTNLNSRLVNWMSVQSRGSSQHRPFQSCLSPVNWGSRGGGNFRLAIFPHVYAQCRFWFCVPAFSVAPNEHELDHFVFTTQRVMFVLHRASSPRAL